MVETRLLTLPEIANKLETYRGRGRDVAHRAAAAARKELALIVQPLRERETGCSYPVPDTCSICRQNVNIMDPSENSDILILPRLHALHTKCFISIPTLKAIGNFSSCPGPGCKYSMLPLLCYLEQAFDCMEHAKKHDPRTPDSISSKLQAAGLRSHGTIGGA